MAQYFQAFEQSGFAVGVAYYEDNAPVYSGSQDPRIVITIEINELSFPVIIDTGTPWCVFNPEFVKDVAHSYIQTKALNIRGLSYKGQLCRVPIILLADEGEDLAVEVIAFIPDLPFDETWILPNFIGLEGCLNQIRFAVDGTENTFYFGGEVGLWPGR